MASVLYTTWNIGGRGVQLSMGGSLVPEAVLTTVRGNRRFVFLNHPPRPIYGRADVCYLRRSNWWQVRPHVPPFNGRGYLIIMINTTLIRVVCNGVYKEGNHQPHMALRKVILARYRNLASPSL